TADSTFMKYTRLSLIPGRDTALPCPYTSQTWNMLYLKNAMISCLIKLKTVYIALTSEKPFSASK
ncbi:hypothetical protein QT971_26515, partial [Microcoleus sp. herbarium19]|uniref:hypothetical protein n=1 Tax=Microcoleus sp. herbarium13 TaxID=3055438 RepID=UPI002FD3B453